MNYLLGYVVGCIYPHDGGEWLFIKDRLVGWRGNRRENATIYETTDAARRQAERLAESAGDWPVFYRPYFLESSRPQKLPVLDGIAEPIFVTPLKGTSNHADQS